MSRFVPDPMSRFALDSLSRFALDSLSQFVPDSIRRFVPDSKVHPSILANSSSFCVPRLQFCFLCDSRPLSCLLPRTSSVAYELQVPFSFVTQFGESRRSRHVFVPS